MAHIITSSCTSFYQTFHSSFPSLPFSTTPSNSNWKTVPQKLKSRGRFSCFFADNSRQEQARKALESALQEKKSEFEKWNREIRKREEVGGANMAGGRGWFGGGGWFGGSNGEHFWKETQQTSLAIVGIILVYLLIAKGNVMLAILFNLLLFVMRGVRSGLTFISTGMLQKVSPSDPVSTQSFSEGVQKQISAKDAVVRKWGMD